MIRNKDNINCLFDDIIINDRNTLKLFNNLYIKFKFNEISNDYIGSIYKTYDKNKSRFVKNLEISFKICNNEKIINSNFIFLLYTFNSIKRLQWTLL